MKTQIIEKEVVYNNFRLMFFDEAAFGRISTPSICWSPIGVRPTVPCHSVREYIYVYGAVSPHDGENLFISAPQCNTVCVNIFLDRLSRAYPDDYILLVGDNAAWHKAQSLQIPANIRLTYIPPYTPEMNPIEQIWKEIRTNGGFKNRVFSTLTSVINQLQEAIRNLKKETVKSITLRDWF